jgi:hypothetical protein
VRIDASAVDERIRLRALDWNSSLQPNTDVEIFFHKECDPELVLGSDIVGAFAETFTKNLTCSYRQVYNPELVLPLVATLRLALAPTEASPAKRAILALSIRNEVTFNNFMTKLQGKYHESYCCSSFIIHMNTENNLHAQTQIPPQMEGFYDAIEGESQLQTKIVHITFQS